MTEPDVMRLIVSSKLPEAEAFERWVFEDVLPSLRKTGGYSVKPMAQASEVTALQLALVSAQMSADILRIEGSARLGMVRKAHELAGAVHLLPMLPVYAIDTPSGSGAGSSEATASLSALMKANDHLIELGQLNPFNGNSYNSSLKAEYAPGQMVQAGVPCHSEGAPVYINCHTYDFTEFAKIVFLAEKDYMAIRKQAYGF